MAVLVSDDGAVAVTSTVSVMGARLAPAATGPGLVQLTVCATMVHVHPVPLAAVGVRPAGRTSLTEIAAVLPPLPMFETANV